MTCHRGQRWVRAGFVAIAATVLALGAVAAAHADVGLPGDITGAGVGSVALHNELIGTDPVDGAQLNTGPARVTLTFSLPAKHGFSTVIVTGPDGGQWQAGPATEDATTVSTPVRPLGPSGDYTVAWRIVSADGHPTLGTLRFTLTTPGPGAAAGPPPNAGPAGSATPATGTGSTGTPVWPWLAGVGALLAVGVVLALRAGRAKS